ncbi:MAG: DNA repair protein RecO [Bacteroidales bacterium]|nr:DNA repair protein RecO [Bacteroidales bacterium]
MMNGKTEAIVLNKIKYSDNSVIVNFLSRDFGRFAALIRIPKTSKSGLSHAMFFPLTILETEVKLKDTRTIQSVLHCSRVENTDDIFSDINKLAIAQFIAEVALKTIREEESNPAVYDFLRATILNLNSATQKLSGIHICFLKDFAALSGFGLHNNHCSGMPFFNLREGMFLPVYTSSAESLDATESMLMARILTADSEIEINDLNYSARNILLKQMLEYYKMHIPGFGEINSLKVLHEVFTS